MVQVRCCRQLLVAVSLIASGCGSGLDLHPVNGKVVYGDGTPVTPGLLYGDGLYFLDNNRAILSWIPAAFFRLVK